MNRAYSWVLALVGESGMNRANSWVLVMVGESGMNRANSWVLVLVSESEMNRANSWVLVMVGESGMNRAYSWVLVMVGESGMNRAYSWVLVLVGESGMNRAPSRVLELGLLHEVKLKVLVLAGMWEAKEVTRKALVLEATLVPSIASVDASAHLPNCEFQTWTRPAIQQCHRRCQHPNTRTSCRKCQGSQQGSKHHRYRHGS